jgi:hypothetical protein
MTINGLLNRLQEQLRAYDLAAREWYEDETEDSRFRTWPKQAPADDYLHYCDMRDLLTETIQQLKARGGLNGT